MILQALHRLADIEGLVEDPDFEVKPVAWVIQLDRHGKLLGIADQRRNLNEGSDRKPKYEGKPTLVPRQPVRTSGDLAFFLVDKSEYALGHDPAGKRPREKLRTRLQLFLDQVEACARETGDEAIATVAKFLGSIESHESRIQEIFRSAPWAGNDLFSFEVGLGAGLVHLRPEVREYWKNQRKRPADASVGPAFHCLITGAPTFDAGLFPLLKRVPGGTTSGVAFVSFNASAFESYGLKGNENAPIAREAAEQAATALNRLLHDAWPNPAEPGTTLPARRVRLSEDTVACYWSTSEDSDDQAFTNSIAALLEAEDENSVAKAYQSIWNGIAAPIRNPSAFYVLVLSGAQGRAVVRDWIETTLAETDKNLRQHFADLRIARNARPKKGTKLSPAIPLRTLLNSLAPEGNGDAIPASLEAGIVRAAFTGTPYPIQILQRALLRTRAEIGRDEWIDAARRDARASLLRAVLNRRRSDSQAKQRYPEVPVEMNPQIQSEGYRLGLLMAVLERVQTLALGDVNASVVDRFFSAASATPRPVFVRLLKNSQHHLRKAGDSDEQGSRVQALRLRRIIDDVCDRFDINVKRYPPRAEGLPGHLDLEQQGLFVLGYHQMRHWLWMNNEERRAWEDEHQDASRAFLWSRREPSEPAESNA